MGMYDIVVISQKLTLNHSNINLDGLVGRWNCITHTFVMLWGEFTPTLKDVMVLMKLPI